MASLDPWLTSLSHVGQIVEDLDEAMAAYTKSHGLEWAPVHRRPARLRDATCGLVETEVVLTWSLSGPVHLELIEEAPGTVWTQARGHPLHHLAYWVDDLLVEVARLQDVGWTVEVTRDGPSEVNGFAYLLSPDGLRVEPKAEGTRPALERWFAGGSLD
jgi:catechol 2,3-dioxygenase-like lactoylglutathione lyase family enzyme